jgi:Family of unknown function (DUF6186)
MNTHDISVAGYLSVIGAGVVLQLLALRSGSKVPTLGHALRRAMRTRSGRIGVVAGWAWIGLHFFAR